MDVSSKNSIGIASNFKEGAVIPRPFDLAAITVEIMCFWKLNVLHES